MSNSLVVVLEEAGAALHEQMQKQSQNPLQAVMENLTPVQRTAIRNALIGAMVGGAGGGGFAAAAKKPVGRPALAGALLGALAGGGGTYGLGLLTGQEKFPGETASPESLIGKGTEALVGLPMRHPLMTIGGVLGGAGTAKYAPTASDLLNQIKALAAEKGSPLAGMAEKGTRELSNLLEGPSLLQRVRRAFRSPDLSKVPKEWLSVQPGRVSRLLSALKPGTRVGQMLKAWPRGLPRPKGRAALALLPVGLGLGYLLDKYIKGQY